MNRQHNSVVDFIVSGFRNVWKPPQQQNRETVNATVNAILVIPEPKQTHDETILQLSRKIRKLPDEIVRHIISYTYEPQPPKLLQDIQNFSLTSEILLNICSNNSSHRIDAIIGFYNNLFLYSNSNCHVVKKIEKWMQRHTVVKKYKNICVIELPNEISLFNKETKWLYLWAIMDPINRNRYLNLLYSIYNI